MSYTRKLISFLSALVILVCLEQGTTLAGDRPTATKLVVSGDGNMTRIEIEVSEETGFSASVVPSPYRVLVRLPDARAKLDDSATKPRGDLIGGLKVSKQGQSATILEFETTGAVLIASSELLAEKGKKKPRIVIDLMAIDDEIFAAAYAKDQIAFDNERLEAIAAAEQVASVSPAIQMPPKKVIKPVPKPEKKITPSAVPMKPKRSDGKRVIVIDPGHGGIDPGAVSKGKTLEKDVVLEFAQVLKGALESRPQFHVELTRSEDKFMSLVERVRFARSKSADLFIALHADTLRGKSVTGTTIYTLSDTATDDEAEALAKKENGADVIGEVAFKQDSEDVTSILVELAQRESKNHAAVFAQNLLDRLKPVTPMTGQPIRAARFLVLRAPEIPSVLLELGFLSNPEDEKRLKSEAWRKSSAAALADAVESYFSAQSLAQRQ